MESSDTRAASFSETALTSHPRRSIRSPKRPASPLPADIRQARYELQLTHKVAAWMIYRGERTWKGWEAGEVPMDPALWELWQIKAVALQRARSKADAPRP